MLFSTGQLSVRHLSPDDAAILVKWLNDERVLEFYEGRDMPHTLQMVEERYLSKQENPVTGCILEFNGTPIGYIQYYPVIEEDKDAFDYTRTENIYGMDQFIGEPSYWNRGIGTLLVSSMVNYLFTHYKASRVIMDPQVRNLRAIHCYEKCGFTKVKLLPEHERHEGAMQDCWLIEITP